MFPFNLKPSKNIRYILTQQIYVITGRNEVEAKVIFLHLFVILFTGGVCLSACWDTNHCPPWEQTPPLGADPPRPDTPQSRHPPRSRPPQEQTHPPPPPGSRPPPPGSRLQYTVYERPVRILLECILVYNIIYCRICEKIRCCAVLIMLNDNKQ